jgi:tetratricopeptide (TPR) repeat protein
MRKALVLASLVVLTIAVGAPALAQMVGAVGANPGQSPAEARELDQKFDELRDKGIVDNPNLNIDKELETGANLVKQSKFAEAIPHLDIVVAKRPNDVTALIYLGFAHRMVGASMGGFAKTDEYMKALAYYRRGLAIEPDNKLLHEYTGKVLVLLNNIPEAQAELQALRKLCPSGCVELSALSAVVPAPTAAP